MALADDDNAVNAEEQALEEEDSGSDDEDV